MTGSSAPRARVVLLVATAVAVVAILALSILPGYLTGTSKCPAHPTLAGRIYCAEVATVTSSAPCDGGRDCPACPTAGFAFDGVEFNLTLRNLTFAFSINGCVTEANSTMYFVQISVRPLGPPPLNWTSPDLVILIEWPSPFVTVGSDGRLTANVMCGVAQAAAT
ncbi:MAG: hypothetical protein ACLPWO_05000 [Thermoplasmata archaeon]